MPLIYTLNERMPDERQVRCPVGWQEVDLDTFQRLYREGRKDDNDIKTFSILTATSYDALWNEQSELLEAEIYRAVAFVANQEQDFRRKPGTNEIIRIDGKKVAYPTKLDKLTVGQNFMIRGRLAKAEKDKHPLETLISYATAVYLQPIVDGGSFNHDRALEIERDLLSRNIYEVFPIGFFWLSKLNNSGAGGLLFWLRRIRQTARRMLRSLSWPAWKSSSRSTTLACLMLTLALTVNCRASYSSNHSTRSCHFSTFGKSSADSGNDSITSRRNATNN